MALVVGLAVGLGAIAFSGLGQLVSRYTLAQFAGYQPPDAAGESTIRSHPPGIIRPWILVASSTGGALVAGVLVYSMSPRTAGPGTDAAIDSFHNARGKIDPREPVVKTIASAIALGTGTSGGREGPICQIAAGIGSMVGGAFRLSPRDRRILMAAGMGAGVGALFRAPLAGAIFAAEILYSEAELEADVIVPAATASIVAYSVYTQTLSTDIRYAPLFGSADFHSVNTAWDLIPYMLLAIVLTIVGILYVRSFHLAQRTFEKLPVPQMVRPAIGVALASVIAVLFFLCTHENINALAVLGTGYGTLQQAVQSASEIGAAMLLSIAFIKIATTSLSIGSGSPGGVFAPSMVIGGCTSAAVGLMVQSYFPQVANPEAFAIVGMAGFFAAVANTPISTIIMVRALTGDFGLLVPTMLVTSVTFVFARSMRLYRKQVPTRMDSPAHRGDFIVDVLEGIPVREAVRSLDDYELINESMSLDEIVHLLADTHQHFFPVVSSDRQLQGIFTDDDVRSFLYHDEIWKLANASDVMVSQVVCVTPGDSLNGALEHFTKFNLEELPVIDSEGSRTLVGMLRRKEVIQHYNRRVRALKSDGDR